VHDLHPFLADEIVRRGQRREGFLVVRLCDLPITLRLTPSYKFRDAAEQG